MTYQRKTLPSIKARDIDRRRRREFKKLTNEHSLLITLYKNDEIAKHMPELESVLWDFYRAGVFDATKLAVIAFDNAMKKAYPKE